MDSLKSVSDLCQELKIDVKQLAWQLEDVPDTRPKRRPKAKD